MTMTRMLRQAVVLAMVVLGAVAAFAAGVPAGTHLTVRLNSSLNSGSARSGQEWTGTLVRPVVVNGRTLAAAGAPVRGIVSTAKSSGRLHAPGLLSLRVTSVDGMAVNTGSVARRGQGHAKANVEKIGGGAATGALIGGLLAGGKGAGLGALAGGGAGTGVAMMTGKHEANFPAESSVIFTAR